MNNLLAQAEIQLYSGDNGLQGIGSLANPDGSGISNLSSIISMAIGVMTVVAIIWFLFVFITGAIGIIGAGGDKQALESARKKITTGIIGLVVVIAAIFVIDLIGTIFGIKLLDLEGLFNKIVGEPDKLLPVLGPAKLTPIK